MQQQMLIKCHMLQTTKISYSTGNFVRELAILRVEPAILRLTREFRQARHGRGAYGLLASSTLKKFPPAIFWMSSFEYPSLRSAFAILG